MTLEDKYLLSIQEDLEKQVMEAFHGSTVSVQVPAAPLNVETLLKVREKYDTELMAPLLSSAVAAEDMVHQLNRIVEEAVDPLGFSSGPLRLNSVLGFHIHECADLEPGQWVMVKNDEAAAKFKRMMKRGKQLGMKMEQVMGLMNLGGQLV